MVMAGGTGGHVFPGLAVAHCLQAKGWQVRWLGTADRMEAHLVPKNGIEIDFIQVSGFRGKGFKAHLKIPIKTLRAVKQAKLIIQSYQPDVVLGMGGYVSGPGGIAAWLSGIPIVLHEQNMVPGFTNLLLANLAKRVLQGFPSTFSSASCVGNPLRDNLFYIRTPQQRLAGRAGPMRILILGGSQGADILNQIMPKVAEKLGNKITLWHQVGCGALPKVLSYYDKSGQRYHKLSEFIDDISAAYEWADLVVCRSGALTVSEIAAVGLPALFVPFMHQDRQQYWNALPLERVGAAKIIEQSKFNVDSVISTLSGWNRQTLLEMAEKARSLAIEGSTERVAAVICEVANTSTASRQHI
ncbi:undecaprenyldiphospho-muramoylpentapeptide beta-N-acetylglucosaminyltransferase [Candidatus Profftia tarda]|nr:undecaprenyldiphospho-muramoylpentapeptide beta-N-acetylglucosaminyltransferase [Candidatus Profftia tarda]